MQPEEDTRYVDPTAGEFSVIVVGRFHGHRCFVIHIDGELVVYKLQAWPILFPDTRPVGKSDAGHAGTYRGLHCEVGKTPHGDLDIREVRLH